MGFEVSGLQYPPLPCRASPPQGGRLAALEVRARITPLCPTGHLPLKGGDWLRLSAAPILKPVARQRSCVISPLEGEMPGKAEGGAVRTGIS